MTCDVVLNSIDGRNWLLPSWFKPLMKNDAQSAVGMSCWHAPEFRTGLESRAYPALGCKRDDAMRLYPTRTSLINVGENACVSLSTEFHDFASWSPEENDPPSAMPPNGPGINVGTSWKLKRPKMLSFWLKL